MKIKLTYFKSTGKYYSDGTHETDNDSSFYDVVAEVRALAKDGKLPGLVEGAKEFHVLIHTDEKPEWYVPHMIWAGGRISTEYN